MTRTCIAVAGLACILTANAARAEVHDCIEIASVPAVISVQGVHCLKQDLQTAITSSAAITVATNNVTIEMNGFKLGGLGGGDSSSADGIYAANRLNITIRNGTIRGFLNGIYLAGSGDFLANSGHLIERMRIERPRAGGVVVGGTRSTIRDNFILDVGSTLTGVTFGIATVGGAGHAIIGNSIAGVAASAASTGIYTSTTTAPLIRGNQVRDVTGGTSRGIQVHSTTSRAVVQDNLVANTTTGQTGIDASGSTDACIDNVVTNFTVPISGCTLEDGNHTF